VLNKTEKLEPIHPGEVLREEFLCPMNCSPQKLAKSLHVSVETIDDLINCRKNLTAELALRLSRYFGNSPQFWLGLQKDYELDAVKEQFSELIEHEVQPIG